MEFDFIGVGLDSFTTEQPIQRPPFRWNIFSIFDTANAEQDETKKNLHHKVLIVGGGSGGIAVAAQLNKRSSGLDIAIVEPRDKHQYQPFWTLVGAGLYYLDESERPQESVIPRGTTWIKDAVNEFHPNDNFVLTKDGKKISYDYMVVSSGMEPYWDKIKGITSVLGRKGVSSYFSYDNVENVRQLIQAFQGGVAIFTAPESPIHGASPMQIMWLFDDYCRVHGIDKRQVIYTVPGNSMYISKKYSDALEQLAQKKNIDIKYQHTLTEVRGDKNEAVFKDANGKEMVIKYKLLHVAPPMGTNLFLRNSPLAASNGFVDVDKHTLQHNKYKNVFSLGDCANLPTLKSIGALTYQAPTVVTNLLAAMNNQPLPAKYNGYSSYPITTSFTTVMLTESLYDGSASEMFPFDQSKPRRPLWLVQRYIFPKIYWDYFLKGNWYGPSLFWRPRDKQ